MEEVITPMEKEGKVTASQENANSWYPLIGMHPSALMHFASKQDNAAMMR